MRNRAALPILALIVLALTTQGLYLAGPAQRGLPLDDGWIHATYARNLVRYGYLCLNPGEPSTGTTSFLWTGLLAAGRLALGGPVLPPILLGMILQPCLVVGSFLLARDAARGTRYASAAAASVAVLGNLVWISLSGMEATLFLTLGVAVLLAYQRQRVLAAGALAGLLVLTRPEGLALPLVLAIREVAIALRPCAPRPWRRWLALFGPVALAAALYVAVNLAVTGHVLTSTYAGRRWLAGQPARFDPGPLAIVGQLAQLVGSWARYLHRWVFGSILLTWLGVPGGDAAGILLAAAMLLAALVGLLAILRGPSPPGDPPSATRLLLGWAAAHNAAYVLLLPVPGHAGRYQAVNFLLLALLIPAGAARLARMRGALRRAAAPLLALWLALAVGSAALWSVIYRDCVNHIRTVHVACGRWIAENLPSDAVVATFDLGAISYFAERRVVDLGGLVDPEAARALFAGDCVPYLRKKGATHLALVQHAPGDLRVAERLGIAPPAGSHLHFAPGRQAPNEDVTPPSRPRLVPLRQWSLPPERYPLHHAATSNAMPAIVLYRLEPSGIPRSEGQSGKRAPHLTDRWQRL